MGSGLARCRGNKRSVVRQYYVGLSVSRCGDDLRSTLFQTNRSAVDGAWVTGVGPFSGVSESGVPRGMVIVTAVLGRTGPSECKADGRETLGSRPGRSWVRSSGWSRLWVPSGDRDPCASRRTVKRGRGFLVLPDALTSRGWSFAGTIWLPCGGWHSAMSHGFVPLCRPGAFRRVRRGVRTLGNMMPFSARGGIRRPVDVGRLLRFLADRCFDGCRE